MALNPTTQDKRGILERNFNNRFDSRWPNGDLPPPEGDTLVTVTGSGFGVEPNVVFYRDFDRYEPGEPIQLAASAEHGEIGDIDSASMKVEEMNGHKVAEGFHNLSQNSMSVYVPPMQRFDITHSMTVPPNRLMPGARDTAIGGFPSDSGWKPIWLFYSEGNGNILGQADLCCPSHIANGTFRTSGNSVAMQFVWWSSSNFHDNWDWNGLNVFNYVQDCGADPFSDAVTQRLYFTSGVVNEGSTSKPAGTKMATKQEPGFPRGSTEMTEQTANYQLMNVNSFARLSDDNPELTQAGYTNFYIAAESFDGANDYRQKVFIGNAPTFEGCTLIKPKVAESWADDEVRVVCTGREKLWATHVFVRRPDMTHEVKGIAA